MIGKVHLLVDDVIKKQIKEQLKSGCRFTVKIIDTWASKYELHLTKSGYSITTISIEDPQIIYNGYPIVVINNISIFELIKTDNYFVEFRISNTCRRNLMKSFL